MKNLISAIIQAARKVVTCGSIPSKRSLTYEEHVARGAAAKAKVPLKKVTKELWKSDKPGVNNKKSATFYYLRRKFGAIRKSVSVIAFHSKRHEDRKDVEEAHWEENIPQAVRDWEQSRALVRK